MAISVEESKEVAGGIVRALCGGAWVSPVVRMLDEYPLAASGRVLLRGRPVQEIHSVTVDGSPITDWRLVSGYVLEVPRNRTARGSRCCRSGSKVEVDYSYGTEEPPQLARRAIEVLAHEIQLSDSGDENEAAVCRIPERVSSVNRQGMSWTMIDPQEFLSDGRTGIYEVDVAIRSLNPGRARARARVFSPQFPPPSRRTVQ